MIYEFDVGISSHDLLKEHVTVDYYINTRVESDSPVDASLIAAQMGACHGYVTECLYRE